MFTRRVESPQDLERALAIREEVFIREQKVPPQEERDQADATALHVLVFFGDEAVATGRLVEAGDGVGKIGRVAVLRSARGSGAGRAVMEALHAEAEARGARELFLDAQVQVIAFYEQLGYRAEGERFLDAGIWHRRMRRRKEDRPDSSALR